MKSWKNWRGDMSENPWSYDRDYIDIVLDNLKKNSEDWKLYDLVRGLVWETETLKNENEKLKQIAQASTTRIESVSHSKLIAVVEALRQVKLRHAEYCYLEEGFECTCGILLTLEYLQELEKGNK